MNDERERYGRIDSLEKTLLSFMHNPVMGVIIFHNSVPVFLNDKATSITGYSKDDLAQAKSWPWKLIHPDDRPEFTRHLENTAIGEVRQSPLKVRLLHKEGSYHWIMFYAWPVNYPEPNSVILNLTDITAEMVKTSAFKMGHDIFQSCFEDNPAGKLIVDIRTDNVIICNTASTKILGLEAQVISSRALHQLVGYSEERMKSELASLIENGNSWLQFFRKSPDGATHILELTACHIRFNDDEALLVTIRSALVDLKKMKQTEVLKDDLSLLNEAAKELISLPGEDSIYDYTLSLLRQQHPRTMIVFNIKSPDENKVKVRNIYGLSESLLGKAINISGFSPVGKTFDLVERNLDLLRTGKLCLYNNGFEDFVKGYIPGTAVSKIVRLFGIEHVSLIGLKRGDKIFAEIQFYSLRNAPRLKEHFIEALSQLVSEVLHRKHLEKGLTESENKFRGFVEQSTDGIIILNDKGRVINLNHAFEKITGYTREDVEGEFLWSFLASNSPNSSSEEHESFRKGFQKAVHSDETKWFHKKFDRPLSRKDGSEGIFEITTFPVKTQSGFHSCAILRDITEKKQAEKLLQQQARQMEELNQTKDKFFSIIAHDLKSPLGNIIGFSRILKEDIAQKNLAQAGKMTKAIENSAVKVNVLLVNLLEWSRFQTGRISYNPEQFDITRLIEETCDMFRESAKIKKIRMKYPPVSGTMTDADINMVGTILRNLLSNAIKFTPAGGRISVRVKKNASYISVHVNDSGIGMTQEEKSNLFRIDSGFTTRGTDNESGSGLGLILCKEFAEKNRGIIDVKTRKGNGSEFYFTLPGVRQS
ncbi:MAG TPA: PAS domain S-box protein [Bacteroidales bacterium]|nr:PAS domain S-box protein [Bacteroidales bacterium]